MEWISVDDSLPPEEEWVLVYFKDVFNDKHMHVAYREKTYSKQKYITFEAGHNPQDYYGTHSIKPTHWQPLPSPPTY